MAVINRSPLCPLVLVASAGLVTASVRADDLYFAEITPGFLTGHVSRVGTDGAGLVRLLEVGSGIRAIALDPIEHKIYWADVNNFVIARANLDGSGAENVVTGGLIFPSALAIDAAGRAMYWTDQDNWLARSNLDGSGFGVLNETVTHRGVAIDAAAGLVYWSTSDTLFKGKILRSNLDGSGVQTVVSSLDPQFKPSAIALDLAGGKIYWTDYVLDVVSRSNLDGSGVEIIWAAGANHNPRGIVVDPAAGFIYWGQDNDFEGTSGRIMRAGLDGSNPIVLINDIGLPNYLALAPSAACYADCDQSTGAGTLDFFDFICFQDFFAAGDPYACDCDETTGPGVCDFFDFICFQDAFAGGC